MKRMFQKILDEYIDGSLKVDSSSEVYNTLIREIPNELTRMLNRKDLLIKGSMGQGNKTQYPWVAIMNRSLTNTTQKGLYIVYLFKKNMTGFYITLAQGITNFENLYKSKKYEYATKVANYFKSQIENTSFTNSDIVLGDGKHDLGYGYERTIVISKYYQSNNLTNEVLMADLIELVQIYDFIISHMETASYDQIIKNVIADEDTNILTAEEAIEKIKQTIDPDDEIPFGFVRTITEVIPKIDRTNKFKRITNPKVSKTDYLKKAAKDIKNGLLGEQLVLNYETAKLINLGLHEYSNKIKWASMESDTCGYDIESFDVDDQGKVIPIKIEVKTTGSKVDTEFFISKNEVETSKKYKKNYCVYRVYDVNSQFPKFYKAYGEVEDNFILDPVTFKARYKYPQIVDGE
ncbi:MAG: DUF3578 domain-containing protein [Ureaplasma sp.]|nr:DUF3578 domain-containing protein [Ureaplasma sp.]